MKTTFTAPEVTTRSWHVLDASSASFGRIASQAANLLSGKHLRTYAPNLDGGDFVVILNAAKLVATGNKMEDKMYYRHSGYPGGIRNRTLQEQIARKPEEIIRTAVKGMLPKNRLQAPRLARLKVYAGSEHPHAAQLSS